MTSDGGVLRWQESEGEGDTLRPLHRVYALAQGKVQSGAAFIDSWDEEIDFVLGQGQPATQQTATRCPPPPPLTAPAACLFAAVMPKGVEIALCGVRVGSVCWLRVRGCDYGYSETRRPAAVQASDALFFRLRIVRQEKEKNLHQMTVEDKLAFCLQSERTAASPASLPRCR